MKTYLRELILGIQDKDLENLINSDTFDEYCKLEKVLYVILFRRKDTSEGILIIINKYVNNSVPDLIFKMRKEIKYNNIYHRDKVVSGLKELERWYPDK